MPLNQKGFINREFYNNFKIIFYILNQIKVLLLLPLIIMVILIRYFIKIKFGIIYTKTLGNSVLPIEIIYFEKKENIYNEKNAIYVWCTGNIIANQFWCSKIKQKIILLPGLFVIPIVNFFQKFRFGKKFLIPIRDFKTAENPLIIKNENDLSPNYDFNSVLIKNPPLITFSKKEINDGNSFLEKNGISINDKFVCIHVRSNSYRDEKFSSTRNSSIENFSKAVNFLANKGFKVIRIGRDEKIKFNNLNVFDYSINKDQNDFLDFFIISKCNFFIGSPSGPADIAKIFRKPILIHNMSHLPDAIHYKCDFEKIILPKKIFSKKTQNFLSYKDFFNNKSKIYHTDERNKDLEIVFFENTEDELYHATVEMYNLVVLKQNFKRNQSSFFNIYNKLCKNNLNEKIMISNTFYQQNINLFENNIK